MTTGSHCLSNDLGSAAEAWLTVSDHVAEPA